MTTVYQWQVYCVTEGIYVNTWQVNQPTVCPNNNTHTINASATSIIGQVSTQTIKAAENTDGYFETTHVVMSIPSDTPGAITEHDVTWPMDIMLWRTLITPTSDMIGDTLSVLGAPETTVGVITAPATIGSTTLTVNSTVTANVQRGFLITLYDGVNKDVLGRCTAVNVLAGTITVQTATTYAFAAGSAVKISVYTIKDLYITDTVTIDIGTKGFKGKTIPSGMILRVYYTNNSGTAKIIRWRAEYYAQG
jgi:hypothetical protein